MEKEGCSAFRKKDTRSALFFSSRTRHTSSLRDWSSDVCSSDLSDVATASSRVDVPSWLCNPGASRLGAPIGLVRAAADRLGGAVAPAAGHVVGDRKSVV